MKFFSSQFNRTPALVVFSLIIAFIISTGVFLFVSNQEKKTVTTKSESSQQADSITVGDVEVDNWTPIPYFSEDVNFLVYYPSDWETITIGDPRSLYEGQPLVWFGDNSDYYEGTNTLGVYYYNDSGDSFDIWTQKRYEVLAGERGYYPELENLNKGNEQFVQMCFLGHPNYSPMKKCHIFFRREPYIYELRAEGFSKKWQADKYIGEFFSRFSLFRKDKDGWVIKDSHNGGYSIMYPENYSQTQSLNEFNLYFAKNIGDVYPILEGENMNFAIATGYSGGAVQFWYDRNKNLTNTSYAIPKEVVVNNITCIYAEPRLLDDVVNYYSTADIYCQVGNRIYAFQIMSDNSGMVDEIFLEIISTVKFHKGFVKEDNINNYKNTEVGFEFDYLNSLVISEDSGDGIYHWIGFDVDTGDHLFWKHFGVTYQETSLTVEECINDESCLFDYEGLSEHSKTKFLGLDAFSRERESELYDEIKTIEKVTIIKKGNYIIKIRTVIEKEGNNLDINNIVDSFKFL